MKIRVLGASGAEFPSMNPPAFLLDETMLLDAGTIGAVLTEDEQWKIKEILLTHAHLDHIKGIPFLADNIIIKNMSHTVKVMSIWPVLHTLKQNLLNDRIWPDFTVIPSADNPVISLVEIKTGRPFMLNGYRITACGVNHSVEAVGYLVENEQGRRLMYSGDTGPTEEFWKMAGEGPVHAAIIEVSMPNSMEHMAILTGHLTAGLLKLELRKMRHMPENIYITHLKPQYLKTITEEIEALGMKNIRMLTEGLSFTV